MLVDGIRMQVVRRWPRSVCRVDVSEAALLLRMRLLPKTGVWPFGTRLRADMRLCLRRSFLVPAFLVLAFVLFILVARISLLPWVIIREDYRRHRNDCR
jgi:hypothetical protein